MSWSNGSSLMGELIESIASVVGCEYERKEIYLAAIRSFIDYDCDTLHECCGVDDAFDTAMREVFPTLSEDD